ncbi:MAG: transglutaminase family protein [Nitriliruptoraceae bacterium]
MRLNIRYLTRFDYAEPVSESQNELRACPATDQHQQLVHYDVTVSPSSRVASYLDYWGTRVDTFGIRQRHDHLEVVAEATVDTLPADEIEPGVSLTDVRATRFRDEHFPFLQPSPHADWGDAVTTAAQQTVAGCGDDAVAAVLAIHERAADLDYEQGRTYVGVDVDRVFQAGAGVCQDFAHLAVAMYRAVGIPARYVSGYLFTIDDSSGEDTAEDEVEVQTHAWVEVALPRRGWCAFDPTNRQTVSERHVTIGRGRDYEDVAPLRGVFNGSTDHELLVRVTMRRLSHQPAMPTFGSGLRRPHHQPQPHPQHEQQQQQ